MALPPSGQSIDLSTRNLRESALQRLQRGFVTVLFWSAITLPALYIPLVAVGPDSRADSGAIALLLGLHALTLVTSHSYNTE